MEDTSYYMVHNLSEKNSIANQFLFELRDRELQQDRMRFRKNMERLGQIMAVEISTAMVFYEQEVTTPLSKMIISVPVTQPVLVTVMRAGLPYHQGFVNYFDRADSGFIGAYRDEGTKEIKINLDYIATPSLEGRDVILIDPMLATGKSFVKSVNVLMEYGKPRHLYMAALVATMQGIDFIKAQVSVPFSIWTFAIDSTLNDQFYIVPGLGDAGDLSYGEKL